MHVSVEDCFMVPVRCPYGNGTDKNVEDFNCLPGLHQIWAKVLLDLSQKCEAGFPCDLVKN